MATDKIYQGIGAEMMGQLRRLSEFTGHAPSVGRHHEEILKSAVGQMLSGRHRIRTGFACAKDGSVSKQGDLNFHSTSYQWLVISGPRAQYKGDGTVNGEPGFRFLLTAIDGDRTGGDGIDRFRMKIIHTASDTLLYDNKAGSSDTSADTTVLGGGSILIHTKKKK